MPAMMEDDVRPLERETLVGRIGKKRPQPYTRPIRPLRKKRPMFTFGRSKEPSYK